jgi:hypothetical protein
METNNIYESYLNQIFPNILINPLQIFKNKFLSVITYAVIHKNCPIFSLDVMYLIYNNIIQIIKYSYSKFLNLLDHITKTIFRQFMVSIMFAIDLIHKKCNLFFIYEYT